MTIDIAIFKNILPLQTKMQNYHVQSPNVCHNTYSFWPINVKKYIIPRLDSLNEIVYLGHTLTLGSLRVNIDGLWLFNASFKLTSLVVIV